MCHLGKERRTPSNFRKWQDNAGMSMKTKDRLSAAPAEAGMSLIVKGIRVECGNVTENKGGRH
jgi:hypothetical protein